ncbi:hypothetical protein AB1P65_09325 [Roseibium alexandrii]
MTRTITITDNSGAKPIIIPVKEHSMVDRRASGGAGHDSRYMPTVSISLPHLPGFMK